MSEPREFSYYVDPGEGLFARILADVLDRQFRAGALDFAPAGAFDAKTSLQLTSRPGTFRENPFSLLFLTSPLGPGPELAAAEPWRAVAVSRQAAAALQLLTPQAVMRAELPAGPAAAFEGAAQAPEAPAMVRLVRCSEEGCEILEQGSAAFAALPALAALDGIDVCHPIVLHAGEKSFAGLAARAAASVAAGCLAVDLSHDSAADCGDLAPHQTTGPLLGPRRGLQDLAPLCEIAADPAHMRIACQRQRALLPAFNAPREAHLAALLRRQSGWLIEKRFEGWHRQPAASR